MWSKRQPNACVTTQNRLPVADVDKSSPFLNVYIWPVFLFDWERVEKALSRYFHQFSHDKTTTCISLVTLKSSSSIMKD